VANCGIFLTAEKLVARVVCVFSTASTVLYPDGTIRDLGCFRYLGDVFGGWVFRW